MFRIDSPGATIDNKFTEGNPALGIPATEVSADWLNDTVQEELCGVVEAAGLTLAKLNNGQLLAALGVLIQNGGLSQIKQAVNNAASAVDITGLVFDKNDVVAAEALFHLERRTDSGSSKAIGRLRAVYDNEAAAWSVDWSSFIDGSTDTAGVTFTITSSGQLKYTSDSLAGATNTARASL